MATDVTVTSSPDRTSPDHTAEIEENRVQLRRLDRRDWFRWASVLLIALLLTGGMFSLSVPIFRRDWLAQAQLNIHVWGLLALVLLFAAYTVYQQVLMTRLRQSYASRVAMAATLEVLKPPIERQPGHSKPRAHDRYYLDRRVTVECTVNGKRKVIYGRTSDISEGGIGAVLPEALTPGNEVTLHLPLGHEGADLILSAELCHSRGFYHGFEFRALGEAERGVIRKACEDGVPLRWFRGGNPYH